MGNSSVTSEQLASALHELGIKFVMGGADNSGAALRQNPAELISALAQSKEARLRLSLIPLFLQRPEFSTHVRAAVQNLPGAARLTLQCFYSAAVWLQQKYRESMPNLKGKPQAVLADLFSHDLGLQNGTDPYKNLERLAKRHQELGDEKVNWLGTYQHAWQIWLMGFED
jgi:hypothetical protein